MAQCTRGFCLGMQIGIVEENKFIPIKFEKIKFMRTIVKVLHENPTKCVTAEVVLRQAIKEYTKTEELIRLYNRKGITDSELYNAWRDIVKKNKRFQIVFKESSKRQEENRKSAKKNREMERVVKECIISLTIRRKLKRMRQNNYIHKRI